MSENQTTSGSGAHEVSGSQQQPPARALTAEERKHLDEIEDRLRHMTDSQRLDFMQELEQQSPIVAQQYCYTMQARYNSDEYSHRPAHGNVNELGGMFNIIRTTGDKHPLWKPDPNDPSRGIGHGSPATASEIIYLQLEYEIEHNSGN